MTPKKSPAPAEAGETLGFEQALERLETIVEQLDGGSLTLEESITRYEEGVGLARRLGVTLDEAEKRIERLVASEDGATRTEPMELAGEGGAPDEPAPPRRPRDPVPGPGSEELPF